MDNNISTMPFMKMMYNKDISSKLGVEMLKSIIASSNRAEMQAELTKIVQESKDEQEIEQKFRQLQKLTEK